MSAPDRFVACFGEIVLRLAVPAGELPLQSGRFEVHVGGAEANVAVALAALGHRVRMISAVPEGALGDAAVAELRRHGVDTAAIVRASGRLGVYYHLPGGPMSAAEVTYDRAGSLFATTRADAWHWDRLLDGARWLHLSGVTPALGPASSEATLAAARAARAASVGVSFDGNWRGRLWECWDGDPPAILRGIIGEANVLFGNHRDASLLLGREFSGDGAERRREAALALLDRFPALSHVASTARHIAHAGQHQIVARLDTREDQASTSPAIIAPVVDRIGTGDAFAAGVLDAIWEGCGALDAARRGLALSTLKHGLRGDFAPFSRASVDQASAGPRDVAR